MTDNIHLIPGLGFDRRIFSQLKLSTEGIEYIEYIDPQVNESLQHYVSRLIELNLDTSKSISLIGHSFGGVIAQEIAKQIAVEKIILISSIKSKSENPFHFTIIAKIGLHKFFNKKWTLKTFPHWARFHGYQTEAIQKLFIKMISDKNDQYLQWALYQLSIWKGIENLKTSIIHIHGENDKTFPIKLIKNPIVLENGTHVMVFNQSERVSKLINDLL